MRFHLEEMLPKSIEYARELGDNLIVAFSFHRGHVPSGAEPSDEVLEVLHQAATQRRDLIVAGVMGSTTADAMEMAERYVTVGADALIVFPNAAFRNQPLDPRIPVEDHRAIAEASGLPLLLFQLAPLPAKWPAHLQVVLPSTIVFVSSTIQ